MILWGLLWGLLWGNKQNFAKYPQQSSPKERPLLYEKTRRFSQYMNTMFEKYIGLATFGGGLLENKHVPYEGLVIETSNAQHGMFSFKNPTIATKRKYFEAK